MGKYASAAQERWANTPAGIKALGKGEVDKRNAASKGKKLPERVSLAKGGVVRKGKRGC